MRMGLTETYPHSLVLELAQFVHDCPCVGAGGEPSVLPACMVSITSPNIPQSFSQNWLAGESHEHVPFVFICDRRQTRRNLVVLCKLDELLDRRVLGVDREPKLGVARRVLVPIVHNRLAVELAELGEGSMHLGAGALKEPTAAASKERVTGEDGARVARRGDVIADRVLRVTRCRQALDRDIAEGERVAILDEGRQRLHLVTPAMNGHTWVFSRLEASVNGRQKERGEDTYKLRVTTALDVRVSQWFLVS
jgi:hypothetical protein